MAVALAVPTPAAWAQEAPADPALGAAVEVCSRPSRDRDAMLESLRVAGWTEDASDRSDVLTATAFSFALALVHTTATPEDVGLSFLVAHDAAAMLLGDAYSPDHPQSGFTEGDRQLGLIVYDSGRTTCLLTGPAALGASILDWPGLALAPEPEEEPTRRVFSGPLGTAKVTAVLVDLETLGPILDAYLDTAPATPERELASTVRAGLRPTTILIERRGETGEVAP